MAIWEKIISNEQIKKNIEWHNRKEIENRRNIMKLTFIDKKIYVE